MKRTRRLPALILCLMLCCPQGPLAVTARAEAGSPVSVGDTLTFGHYEQDGDPDNGAEPIEWLVLDVQGDRALLLSKYGLDAQPYHAVGEDITWENCSLRAWLNEDFRNAAFSAEEEEAVLTTKVTNGADQGYPEWYTRGGNDTQDRLFLLSCAEANRYLGVTASGSSEARAAPAAYALSRGAAALSEHRTANGDAAGWWWLRSPGFRQFCAAYVSVDGALRNYLVSSVGGCVRPAMWVNLDAGIF